MSTIHRIDKKLKTVFVIAKGNVPIEELIDDEKKILNNPEYEKGYNKYVDFSEAKPAPSANLIKIKNAVEYIKSTQNLRGKCKWSICAPTSAAYSFSVLFAILTKKLELETKVFRNECEAKGWLGI